MIDGDTGVIQEGEKMLCQCFCPQNHHQQEAYDAVMYERVPETTKDAAVVVKCKHKCESCGRTE